ncbi:MAG: glycosyltransferase [Gemmatimonadetes bacterium]|nr:glycosyltransferase [Gemmatimonadota bacterium]
MNTHQARCAPLPPSSRERRPRVLVLLATHNGARFVSVQLKSILDQQGADVTVVASDDSSTDGTQELLRAVADSDSRVQLLSPGHFGSAADNFLRLLRDSPVDEADFIGLADQDDIWESDKLVRALDALWSGCADGYSSNLLAFDDLSGTEWIIDKSSPPKALDYLFGGASAGCTYLLSRRAARVVRDAIHTQPLRGWSHDWLFYAICRSHQFPWVFDKTARIRYRQHAANAYGAQSGIQGAVWRARQISSGWYCNQVLSNGRYLRQSSDELSVLRRMAVLGARERLWLAANSFHFRRDASGVIGLAAFMPIMGRGSDSLRAEYLGC